MPCDEKQFAGRVERLRRFLPFCLAIDYDLLSETPDRITRVDFCLFIRLAQRSFLAVDKSKPPIKGCALMYSKPRDITVNDKFVSTELLQPAIALGIPNSVAISMLRLFVASLHVETFWRVGYRSRLLWLQQSTDMNNLAAKFFMERNLIVDSVLPPATTSYAYRALFRERLLSRQQAWFEKLDGPADYQVTAPVIKRLQHEPKDPKYHAWRMKKQEGGWGVRYDCWFADLMMKAVSDAASDESWIFKRVRHWLKPREQGFFETSKGFLGHRSSFTYSYGTWRRHVRLQVEELQEAGAAGTVSGKEHK